MLQTPPTVVTISTTAKLLLCAGPRGALRDPPAAPLAEPLRNAT